MSMAKGMTVNRTETSYGPRSTRSIDIVELLRWSLPSIIGVMAFGPYVVGSIRVEQLFLYGMLMLFLPFALLGCSKWYGWSVLLPWLTLLAVALISDNSTVIRLLPWESNSLLAGADALLIPVAVMVLVWTCVPVGRGKRAFDSFASTVIVLGLLNAVLVLMSIVVNITGFLRMFWASGDASITVAERALTLGRYSGIFNQPAESGAFYSVALLLAVYKLSRTPTYLIIVFIALSFGAVFSVSKVVLFVGLPVALGYMFLALGLWRVIKYSPLVILTGATVLSISSFLNWSGLSYLTRFLEFGLGDDFLSLLTAGRFSGDGDSTLMAVIGPVAQSSPIIGAGLSGVSTAYDSGWVEVFVYAGAIGVICMIFIYFGILLVTLGLQNTDLRSFGFAFLVATFLVNTGISVFTANRVATFVWITIALLFLCLRDERMAMKKARNSRRPRNARV